MKQPWWNHAIVYQIYPKSFKDMDHDGVGDIKGIITKLDYIQSLGVTILWLNPIFKSPQVDHGYDISDYYQIDEQFGTMEDMDVLISESSKRGLKIILDLVVNHTSDQHPWFRESMKSKTNPYRDYYIWRDGKNGKEPTNWASFFEGSAWTYEQATEQYFFHLFDKKMPDLNWENPKVRKEVYQIAAFWLKKGIAGFRLDAIIHLAKDQHFQNIESAITGETYVLAEACYAHVPRVHEFIHGFYEAVHKVEPDVFLIGEAASANSKLAKQYTDPDRNELDCIISFEQLETEILHEDKRLPRNWQIGYLNLSKLKKTMKQWQKDLSGHGWSALFWNNHDMPRLLSRFGDAKYPRESATMLATMLYLHRGIPIIYQGEEIGMTNLRLPEIADYEDSGLKEFVVKAEGLGYSKDEILTSVRACSRQTSRGAMQWNGNPFAGFSEVEPWLGVNDDYPKINVEKQERDPVSILNYYRKLLKIRSKWDIFVAGDWQLIDEDNQNLYVYKRHYGRKSALVICNFTSQPQPYFYPELSSWTCILSNNEGRERLDNEIILSAYECLVVTEES
ncbi:glycoside hydrolase family 13 protein [Sporolactobacillus nakayamae]|uniref:Oligo-1,6-glucosidase n=1 Tax=Sporolactobacillus nakayamae TaxID=269670 RepID=A0A1I2TS82_9BACL|nr:alpha-glucosidase [Sporolactobacillus nakayamae]SFG67774.1 oligo-1,6-glucosidase [Sporolactobacillus nakayamae]